MSVVIRNEPREYFQLEKFRPLKLDKRAARILLWKGTMWAGKRQQKRREAEVGRHTKHTQIIFQKISPWKIFIISPCVCVSVYLSPTAHTQIIFLRSATVSLKYQRSKENGDGSSRKLASKK